MTKKVREGTDIEEIRKEEIVKKYQKCQDHLEQDQGCFPLLNTQAVLLDLALARIGKTEVETTRVFTEID